MTRNLRTLFARVKAKPRPRTESPQETIARLERRATELERRNRILAEESLQQAGYIRFLTGKCVAFECDRLARAAERGGVVS